MDEYPDDGRRSVWHISFDSRGITTLGARIPPNDDPYTIEYLIYSDGARSPVGGAQVPPWSFPIGVGGHLGDDLQESGGLAG